MQRKIHKVYDDACTVPARNLRVTWKAMLAFWILFLAACCLRASVAEPDRNSAPPQPIRGRDMPRGMR